MKRQSQSLFLSASLSAIVACSGSASTSGGNKTQKTEANSDVVTQLADAGAAQKKVTKVMDPSKQPDTGPARAPQPGFVGSDDLIARETLEFTTADRADAYDKLEACFVRYGEDWTAYPRRRYGNFVNIEWCRGEGSHINCAGGDTRKVPGAGWASLEVLQYERKWPQVFGLSFTTGQIPKQEGIAVAFSWSEGGQSVLGGNMSVAFQSVQNGSVISKLVLGMSQSFALGSKPINSPSKGTPSAVYERLVASPDSLGAEATAQLDGLEAAVEAALTADTPRKCVYGKYQGGGIPPRCIKKVPLDASEKAEARVLLQKILAPQRKLIADHADAMHAGLVELMPTECWTPE